MNDIVLILILTLTAFILGVTMPRTTERGSKTITLFNMFNRKVTIKYDYTKYYREDIMTVKSHIGMERINNERLHI